MIANVTPLHKIVVQVESDQNNGNNLLSKIVRFYIKRSADNLIFSTENSAIDITQIVGSKSDPIAGRLNADSLKALFKTLGWWTTMYPNRLRPDSCTNVGPFVDRFDYDVFDRTGWEPKATDYTIWRSMFWADGDDKPLTRRQRYDIRQFLTVNNFPAGVKKNLCIGSQEMLRSNFASDSAFCKEVLRAYRTVPANPMGDGVASNSNTVLGIGIGTDLTEFIKSTAIDNSAVYFNGTPGNKTIPPYLGNMKIYAPGDGLAKAGYYYLGLSSTSISTPSSTIVYRNDSVMAVRTVSLTKNIVYMGVDWRHWAKGTRVLKSLFDFFEKNNGSIVPVELTDFAAKLNGNRVDITWDTKSENNTSHYEIEKATKNESGVSPFMMINSPVKSNNSLTPSSYGPYADQNISGGNVYIYRLKMIDLNGDYNYSKEVEVSVAGEQNSISIDNVTPSPAVDKVTVKVNMTNSANITIDLFDINGRKIANVFNGFKSGSDNIEINLSDVSSGAYTIVLKSGDVTLTKQIQVVK
jgi:hypothetical protein